MAPEEYLRRNLSSGSGTSLPWLLPLLYVLLALSLVSWAGMRHSNRSRRGRALFVFTVGIVLIVLASGFFLLRAFGTSGPVGVGAAATLLACAMLVVAAGSLLPSVEDWFGARRELQVIQPILKELGRRHPDVGIGVRPRGPLVFRVAERMSLISDALFLEATAADSTRRLRVDTSGAPSAHEDDDADDDADLEVPSVTPEEQARAIAEWIYGGRDSAETDNQDRHAEFPGLGWLRQPAAYSDREWILEIAREYRRLVRTGETR
jgi:4-amino-4-deoxy-L-arabinose transferase-like glycosyltransferase